MVSDKQINIVFSVWYFQRWMGGLRGEQLKCFACMHGLWALMQQQALYMTKFCKMVFLHAKEMGSKNPEISFWWFKNFNVFLYFICNYNTWNKTQQCKIPPPSYLLYCLLLYIKMIISFKDSKFHFFCQSPLGCCKSTVTEVTAWGWCDIYVF